MMQLHSVIIVLIALALPMETQSMRLGRLGKDKMKRQSLVPERDLTVLSERDEQESSVNTLIRLLKSGNSVVRRHAAEALSNAGSPAAVPALIASLQGDEDVWVRSAAASTLGTNCSTIEGAYPVLGGDERYQPVPPLLAAVRADKHSNVRLNVVRSLAKCRDEKALPALIAAAQADEDHSVRIAAVKAVGDLNIADDEKWEAIVKAELTPIFQQHDDPDMRLVAAEALCKLERRYSYEFEGVTLCGEEEVLFLISALDPANDIGRAIKFEGLPHIYGTIALQALRRGLLAQSWLPQQRAAAILALTSPHDHEVLNEALPDLLSVVNKHPELDVRIAAVKALGESANEDAIPALIATLNGDSDWRLRQSAAESLGGLHECWYKDHNQGRCAEEAVPDLISTMHVDENKFIRKSAISALGMIGSVEALPALIGAMKEDKAASTRSTAVVAVAHMDTTPEVVDAIIVSMQVDQASEVRSIAVKSLAPLIMEKDADETVVADGVEALIGVLQGDEDETVRAHAAEALRCGWVTSVAPALIDAMQSDRDPHVRRAAVRGLGWLGPTRTLGDAVESHIIALLIDTLQTDDDDDMRMVAAQAIGEFHERATKAVPALISAMETDVALHVREKATAALGEIALRPEQCSTAVPALKKRELEDADFVVRVEAETALMWGCCCDVTWP